MFSFFFMFWFKLKAHGQRTRLHLRLMRSNMKRCVYAESQKQQLHVFLKFRLEALDATLKNKLIDELTTTKLVFVRI